MKTYKQFLTECYDLLTEGRIDVLKQKFKNKLDTSHDTLAKHKDSDAIVDHFANNADPSVNKQNTQWILGQYQKKNIRQEDAPRVHSILRDFERLKPRIPNEQRNIMNHKRLSDLSDLVDYHTGSGFNDKSSVGSHETSGDDVEKIYDSPSVSVISPKTQEASQRMFNERTGTAAKTKWCTAWMENCQFHHYNDEGKLYVIRNKKTNDVYQYHPESNQLMDRRDNPVEPHNLKEMMPELTKVKEFQDKSLHFMPHGKLIDAFRNIHTKPESMQREFVNFDLDNYKPVYE